MNRTLINRLTEALAVLCAAAGVLILARSATVPVIEGSLADMKVQVVAGPDMERFHTLLDEARRITDSNGDPDPLLQELEGSFPGRHEVWALAARNAAAQGRDGEALLDFARAVRLQPDYLDERSVMFLGKRIEALTGKVMAELDAARTRRDLDSSGKELLKTAYFLRRQMAGGCE